MSVCDDTMPHILLRWQLTILSWWFVYIVHKPAVIVRGWISVENISPVQSNTLETVNFNRHLLFKRPGLDPPTPLHHKALDNFTFKFGWQTNKKRGWLFWSSGVGKLLMGVCCSAAGFHTLYWETTECACACLHEPLYWNAGPWHSAAHRFNFCKQTNSRRLEDHTASVLKH